MYKKDRIIAIIPARGGSKGLPGKNIRHINGKPMIAWTVVQARDSRYIDEIIVSTEDSEIAAIAKKSGASVPFIRPASLATDKAGIIDVLLHAVNAVENKTGPCYDSVMLLQPTSPLRTTHDIDNCVKLLYSKKAESVISVTETDHHPYWSNMLPSDGNMSGFIKKKYLRLNRQQLPKFYRVNGAVYLVRRDHLVKNKSLFGNRTYAYMMPKERSVDIDDGFDFIVAELLLKSKKNKSWS